MVNIKMLKRAHFIMSPLGLHIQVGSKILKRDWFMLESDVCVETC